MTFPSSLAVFMMATLVTVLPARASEPAQYAVVDHIHGADGRWDLLTFDATLRRVFVARGDGVMAVDADSGTVTPQLTSGDRVHGVITLPGGNMLFTNGHADTAVVANARDGSVKATIPTGKNPDAAVFDPISGLAFVMDAKAGDITVIDVKTLTAVGQIAVGGKLEAAVIDGNGHLYVNLEDTGEIAAIDIRARKVADRYKLEGCDEPSGLAYVKKERLLISACANGKAMFVAAADGKTVMELPIGPKPDGAIYDDARHLAFIPSGGNATLAVIRVSGLKDIAVVQTVATKAGARTLAEDPKTGRIFLPVADMDPPASPDARPIPRPGTFEILVVGPSGK